MDQPLITIHRPVRRGDRWTARADINAKGELLEFQATASERLAQMASSWYNRASSWLGQWIQFEGFDQPPELGTGVFADLPALAHEVATSIEAIPFDEDVRAAAQLYRGLLVGEPESLALFYNIVSDSETDQRAAEALETLQIVDVAATRREELPLARIFYDAARGEPEAQKVLAALREVTPGEVTRFEWSIDDYEREGPVGICTDLQCACADEIGARIIAPQTNSRVRQLRPSWDEPMLRTYQAMLAQFDTGAPQPPPLDLQDPPTVPLWYAAPPTELEPVKWIYFVRHGLATPKPFWLGSSEQNLHEALSWASMQTASPPSDPAEVIEATRQLFNLAQPTEYGPWTAVSEQQPVCSWWADGGNWVTDCPIAPPTPPSYPPGYIRPGPPMRPKWRSERV